MTSEHKPDAGKIADAMLAKSREHLMGSDANFERVHAVMANLTVRAQSFVSVECVVEVLAAIERLSPQPVAFVNSYELAKLLPDDENAAPDRTPGIQRTQSRFRNVPLYAGPQLTQTAQLGEPVEVQHAGVRDAGDELHIECRMSDGQKGAFVKVDAEFPELAHRIAAFLAAPQPAAPECSLDNCLVPNKCQRAPDCAFGVTAAPAQSAEPVTVDLPPRVIDQLYQAAGVSTYHPDGDQQDKLHVFARNVVAETLARLPSTPAVVLDERESYDEFVNRTERTRRKFTYGAFTPTAEGTEKAREFLIGFMRSGMGSGIYDNFIRYELAGDFAWNLANELASVAQPVEQTRALTDAPQFDAKHVSLKERADGKLVLTLLLDSVEGAPRYKVKPINPGVVRGAARPASGEQPTIPQPQPSKRG